MIEMTCDACGFSCRMPDSSAGKLEKCPNCGGVLRTPEGSEDRAAAAKAEEWPSPAESPMAALQAAVAELEHSEQHAAAEPQEDRAAPAIAQPQAEADSPATAEPSAPAAAAEEAEDEVPLARPAAAEPQPQPDSPATAEPPAAAAAAEEPEDEVPLARPAATEPQGGPDGVPTAQPAAAPAAVAEDEIPMAQPVPTRRSLVIGLVAAGVAVVVVGGIVAIYAMGDSGKKKAMQAAEVKVAEARRLHEQAAVGSAPLESLEIDPLIEKQDVLEKAIARYDEAEAVLTGLRNASKDRELGDFVRSIGLRRGLAEGDLEAVQDALWPCPGSPSEVCEKVVPAVPLVEKADGRGSGFLIERAAELYVVTNRHVVEGAKDGLHLRFPAGPSGKPDSRPPIRVGPESVAMVHRWEDLAVIRLGDQARLVRERNIHPLKLLPKSGSIKMRDAIWVVGYPDTGEPGNITATSTDGTISNIRTDGADQGTSFQMSAPINPGNSGGPVFDSRGRVVGIATRVRRVDRAGHLLEGQNFAVHVSQLHILFDEPRFSVDQAEIARLLDPASQLPKDLAQLTGEFASKGLQPSKEQPMGSPKLVAVLPGRGLRRNLRAKKGKTYRLLALYAATSKLGVVVSSKDDKTYEANQSEHTIYRYVEFTPQRDCTYRIDVFNADGRPVPAIFTLFEQSAEPARAAPAPQPPGAPQTKPASATAPSTAPPR